MIAVTSAKPLYAFGLAIPFWRITGSTGFLEESLKLPMVIVMVRNSVTDNGGNGPGDLVACHQPRNTPFAPLIRSSSDRVLALTGQEQRHPLRNAPVQDRFDPYTT